MLKYNFELSKIGIIMDYYRFKIKFLLVKYGGILFKMLYGNYKI